ncbi:OmpL47-type beta-barrel domain-containing protein [Reichenbachiella ulvae]|uniref:Ig-like domain repeat protein n=1 Tax=Reichenbachiella ulvae TaxID=2980104 RepID=A0ABT3CP75_9BACT|nr:Ig-like domain repeat protein [Reichenbachiella ulvae]MCV9385452.1 Ig-like domain repeat protein [Reichenbachiella ulvae]
MRVGAVVILILMVLDIKAQQPEHQARVYTDSTGKIFWNKQMPVYIRIASSPDDPGVLLTNDEQPEYTDPIYLDTEGVNYIRTRNAVNNRSMKPANPPVEVMLPVYADGQPPVSKALFQETARYVRNGIEYLGRGLKVELQGLDAQSGLDEIYYAIDDNPFQPYTQLIDYALIEGSSTLRYYAVDHVGNAEAANERNLLLDYGSPVTQVSGHGPQMKNSYTFGSTLQLSAVDSLSGVDKIYYQIDEQERQVYNQALAIDALSDGFHMITYYSVDHVLNQEEPKSYEFYMDKSAPLTSADILGDRFIVDDQIYFSGRTKLKFTAVDNRVGVKEVRYSVNDEGFQTYDNPFYLPNKTGTHQIRYYAVDHFGNKTFDENSSNPYNAFEHHATKVYVDLTGPNLSYDFVGEVLETRDTVFVRSDTQIKLSAHDTESGLQKITYSLEGSPVEYDYETPFMFDREGYHAVDFYGYDNVNNRNVSHMNVFVDNKGADIYCTYSSEGYLRDGQKVYSPGLKIYLAAQDNHVGVRDILYSINGEQEQSYTSPIRGLRKEGKYKIKIIAFDLLGNRSTKEIDLEVAKK